MILMAVAVAANATEKVVVKLVVEDLKIL